VRIVVLDDIRSTLEWYFDDGKEDESDAQLAALIRTHASPTSHDAMAAALFDFAELADRHRAALSGLGGFNIAIVDEARAMALALRERSAGSTGLDVTRNEADAYVLRNRIGTLLSERMARTRAGAKFVFRKHPELVREVTSEYERRARSARRRRDEADDTTAPAVAAPPVAAPPVAAPAAPVGPSPVSLTSLTAD
jgi:hypothetical protein